MSERSYVEQIKVAGEELVEQVERLIHEGNVRRIVIKQDDHTIAEFPLTIGIIGVALAPILAAVGALAAVLTHCTIEVERIESTDAQRTESERAAREAAEKELMVRPSDETMPPR
ncbi:MAG TPA: DUF4342 domain-containing protein [Chthonomonadaceae bacterium]|nr:DUF4342 domain-containing protein [Chthonomonadaceae bacterium]